jgi:uncharacterized short protein YbdD (DUF466 family)
MIETVAVRSRFVCEMAVKTARLMVGIPDYQTYVTHRRTTHPDPSRVLPKAAGRSLFRQQRPLPRRLLTGRWQDLCCT